MFFTLIFCFFTGLQLSLTTSFLLCLPSVSSNVACWVLKITMLVPQIGYVGQEPVLFTGSIELNIANGKPGATHDESESLSTCRSAETPPLITKRGSPSVTLQEAVWEPLLWIRQFLQGPVVVLGLIYSIYGQFSPIEAKGPAYRTSFIHAHYALVGVIGQIAGLC